MEIMVAFKIRNIFLTFCFLMTIHFSHSSIRNLSTRSHLSGLPLLAPGLSSPNPKLLSAAGMKNEHTLSDGQFSHPKSLILCKGSETRDCKPSSVEYFASSIHRDGDKIIMLSFDFDKKFPQMRTDQNRILSDGEIHSVKGHGDIKKGGGSSVHVDIDSDGDVRVNEGKHPLPAHSHIDSHRSANRKDRITVCAPENEHVSMSQLTNQINLMSHVFCRQMGYMTYVGRSAANVIDDKERTIWPSVICNGTEQRLEDCYWPDVTLTYCKQVLEVQCGSCSKYFSHVDDGVIISPGFPNSFPFTVECDWLIYTHLGQGIELKFVTFNFPTSQLPMQQIGSSSCVAANAFLEIKPNGDTNPMHVQTLTNSNRYCVTRSPDRKMVIRSKAVWLHFSSGIHSNFFWNYRSRPFLKRPVGIKIYFKAISGEPTSEEIDQESSIVLYLVCGISAVVLITLIMLVTAYICIKRRATLRSGESKNSGDGNMNHHIQVVDSWRTATVSDGIGGSVITRTDRGVFNSRDSSLMHQPQRFVTCSTSSPSRVGTITESAHLLRNCANQLQQQGPPPAFGRNNSSSNIAMNHIPNNNYEEIPAPRRPTLPPRFVKGQDPKTKDSPQSTWSEYSKKLYAGRKVSNGNVVSRNGQWQNNIYSRKDGRSISYSEQQLESLREQLTESELAELETSCNSRVYMQIVCDSDGNCQYIPNHEIMPSMLPGQSSFSSPSLQLNPPPVSSSEDQRKRKEHDGDEKQDSPHSLPPSKSPPTQLITTESNLDKKVGEEKQKDYQKGEEEQKLMEEKKVERNNSWNIELKSETGSRIDDVNVIMMKMNKSSSLASVI